MSIEQTVSTLSTDSKTKTTQSEVSVEILRKIKCGWIAGIISGSVTLIFTVLAMRGNDVTGLMSSWSLLDVILIYSLAFGIYKKSRFASTVMFLYFIISKIIMFAAMQKFTGGIFTLIFLYLYFQAMVGTYQFHEQLKESKA